MIFDGERGVHALTLSPASKKVVASFVTYIERKLRVAIITERARVPFSRFDLVAEFRLAKKLIDAGIVHSYGPLETLPDEPPLCSWTCKFGKREDDWSGGSSVLDDKAALTSTLAEALERYIWRYEQDFFESPVTATQEEMQKKGPFLAPERFAGFSDATRAQNIAFTLNKTTKYLWAQGTSLITKEKMYAPAQIFSAQVSKKQGEPLIREVTTNGLATWPTQAGAQLAGALEILERDAFMIMWYNQLTFAKVELTSLRGKSESLDTILERCVRYRLKVHAIPMMTDAPTHAMCVVVEDPTGHAPRFIVGLKAHRSMVKAVESALLEALRIRRTYRNYSKHDGAWDKNTSVEKIGHVDRVYYWGESENAQHLEFLIAGEEQPYQFDAAWEYDSIEQHLEKIVSWCKEKNFECVSVPLTRSKANPTDWHIEMVIIPELQPIHLHEKFAHTGGARLREVPASFGYPTREPFLDRPHPFL